MRQVGLFVLGLLSATVVGALITLTVVHVMGSNSSESDPGGESDASEAAASMVSTTAGGADQGPIDLSTYPNEETTGVPAGLSLTPYAGPCTITRANSVIDARTVDCDLRIQARGVVISRSKINGNVAIDEASTGYSFTISDSEVAVGERAGTGIGAINFTARRVLVTGGNRSILCQADCTVEDSYVHGQYTDEAGGNHESGIRIGQRAVLRHNTILCDAPDVPPDGGCSASLTGYGDFSPIRDNLIENNLFPATSGGYCAYGGSSKDKPYSSNAANIVFRANVFERGDHPSGAGCGVYGPISDFDPSAPGNVWEDNRWEDGAQVGPLI